MSEPVKIVVVIEGGIVQAVLSGGVKVRAVIVDYDTEGADPEDFTQLTQDDGTSADAFIHESTVTAAGAFVETAFAIAGDQP